MAEWPTTITMEAGAAKDLDLVLLVGDAKALGKTDGLPVLAQQLDAERMDGRPGDLVGSEPETVAEPMGDFAGGLIGEGDRDDALG